MYTSHSEGILNFSCGWVGGWVGVENEINAISAFNQVVVEVEAELGPAQPQLV